MHKIVSEVCGGPASRQEVGRKASVDTEDTSFCEGTTNDVYRQTYNKDKNVIKFSPQTKYMGIVDDSPTKENGNEGNTSTYIGVQYCL